MNAQDIYQQAAQIKKPTKPKAFEELQKLIENGLDDHNTTDRLARLYAFFLPKISKPKTPEQWITVAMADKNDVRPYLRWVYSDGKRLIATNGHRLHIMPATCEPGYYDSQLNRIHGPDYDARFPDVDQVIPQNQPESVITTQDLEQCEIVPFNGKTMAYKLPNDGGMQKQYMDQALAGMDNPRIALYGPMNPIKITDLDSDRLAVVMPCKL